MIQYQSLKTYIFREELVIFHFTDKKRLINKRVNVVFKNLFGKKKRMLADKSRVLFLDML